MHAFNGYSGLREGREPRAGRASTALAGLALALLLGLVSGLAGLPGPAAAQGKGGGKRPPTPVVVSPVKQINRAPTYEYTGLIEPVDKALLSAEVSGRVYKVLKRQGDVVREGEVMASLENPSMERELQVLQAQVAASQAELALRRQQQQRTAELFRRNLTSAETYEDGQAQVAVTTARLAADKARVSQLEDQLSRMVIRAPLGGQVVRAELEVGQWITPNNVLYEIYNYEQFDVRVGVPGRYVGTVPDEGRVHITVPELGRSLTGDIHAKIRHVQSATGNFTLRLRVRNPEGLPLSGLLAKVQVPLGPSATVLTVPRDAIVRQGGATHVVIVRKGVAQVVPVKVRGDVEDAVIVAADGLSPGEQVVVRGNERLFPGVPVQVTDTLPTLGTKG